VHGGQWPSTISAVQDVSDAQLRWLYANSAGLVAAAFEDFGLTPLEANAFGKPAVLLRAGGFLDTLVEGTTGIFIDELTTAAVIGSVRRCVEAPLDPAVIAEHARSYSVDAFAAALHEEVDSVLRRSQ
jgi:glycosyltransferase involved in cell wall biosynthesis